MSTTRTTRIPSPAADAAAADPEDWSTGPAAWGARPLRARRIAAGDLFLIEATCVALLVVLAVALLERPFAPVVALGVGLAALGGHAAWRARRKGRRGASGGLERRVLTRDVYGLKARFISGEVVEELTRGTRVVLGQNPAGEVCLYAYGREYPLSPADLHRVREASDPARGRRPLDRTIEWSGHGRA